MKKYYCLIGYDKRGPTIVIGHENQKDAQASLEYNQKYETYEWYEVVELDEDVLDKIIAYVEIRLTGEL